MSRLIVFALEDEAQGLFSAHAPVFSGVGKVNAAYALAKALGAYEARHGEKPSLIVNLGSAGSPVFPAGAVVACTGFYQRDMDCTALGLAPHATPFQDGPAMLGNGLPVPGLPQAICGSGDSFVTNSGDHPWSVVDMEAYALARIAALEGIPFLCLKYITDGADGTAAGSWVETLPLAAAALMAAYERAAQGL